MQMYPFLSGKLGIAQVIGLYLKIWYLFLALINF